ncbi:hypothetical protein [Pseudonocardia lacus]|uniref:hypothetical protein n=1 Tax=Pseudonocardia lacus TaxID=2835865 RepID=UPI001BDD40F7|nr:hypothetical protein [Pseudonocardia lacus]
MLKKTGIIVATAAAGLLAVGGFAFATTPHHDEPTRANYSNVEEGNLGNDCAFGQQGALVDQDLTGGSGGLLGVGGAVTGAVAPVQTATQALNCTNINVSDVADIDSGNTTRTETETEVEDSNNSTTTVGG